MIAFVGCRSHVCNFLFFSFYFGGIKVKDFVQFSFSINTYVVSESFSDFTVFVRLHMLWPQAWVQMNFNIEDLSCLFCG